MHHSKRRSHGRQKWMQCNVDNMTHTLCSAFHITHILYFSACSYPLPPPPPPPKKKKKKDPPPPQPIKDESNKNTPMTKKQIKMLVFHFTSMEYLFLKKQKQNETERGKGGGGGGTGWAHHQRFDFLFFLQIVNTALKV